MPHHRARVGTAGVVFHVLNRAVRRSRMFESADDYAAALSVLAEARSRLPLQIFAYCVMPNHFHLVVRPTEDNQLSSFMQWFTATHSKRWHAWRDTTGTGAVYQGRFKAFAVQSDSHFLTVCRYVEQNALRAGLVPRAEEWLWSSLSQRLRKCNVIRLEEWPVPQPADWIDAVNWLPASSDVDRIRRAVRKGSPFGELAWSERMARTLGMTPITRNPGRPAIRKLPRR